MKSLSEFRVAEYCLSLDLLGTASQMSDFFQWLPNSLRDILDTIVAALDSKGEQLGDKKGKMYQYGDTISFSHHDPNSLVSLGTAIIKNLFARDILAQAAVAGGEVYYIDDLPSFRRAGRTDSSDMFMCLVGPAVARTHEAMRGIKGPRLLVDCETVSVDSQVLYLCNEAKRGGASKWDPNTPNGERAIMLAMKTTDVKWWRDVPNIDKEVDNKISNAKREIDYILSAVDNSNDNPDIIAERRVQSLKSRVRHLYVFKDFIRE